MSDVTLQLFIAGLYTFVVLIPFAAAANDRWASRLRRLVPIVPLRLSWLFILAYLVSQLAVLTFPALADTRAHAFEAARLLDGLVGKVISALIVVAYPLNGYPNAEVRELVISVLAAYTGYVVFRQLGGDTTARLKPARLLRSEDALCPASAVTSWNWRLPW